MATYPTSDMLMRIVKKSAEAPDSVGLPLGVQVIGRPYQEELVLHAMAELERAAKKNGP